MTLPARSDVVHLTRLVRSMSEHLPDLFAFVDAEERFRFASRAYRDWYGVKPEALLGRTLADALGEDIYGRLRERVREVLAGLPVHFEVDLTDTPLGRWVEARYVPARDCAGEVAGFTILARDITEKKESETYAARHDALTGLAGRREFAAALEGAVGRAREHSRSHAVIFLDLDQFKVVNDTCGHLAGDQLLRDVAAVLAQQVRDSDVLARLGGDEFAVLLEGCPLPQAKRIAQGLIDAVRAMRFEWQGRLFRPGASAGVAAVTADTPDSKSVLSAADAACYLAKDLGRDRVQVHELEDAEMLERHGELHWVSRIAHGIEQSRFDLYFQRIVPLQRRHAGEAHREVLLRMRDEQGAVVAPASFLPAAERYSLAPRLDRWVISTLLGHLGARYRGVARPSLPCYAVNLSGLSLSDPSLLDFVLEEFARSGTPYRMICFEITETAAITHFRPMLRFVENLREYGCRFALDDFGRGLSSLAYLKSLPLDYLKIDGGFVRNMLKDRYDSAIVEAVCRMSREMRIRTIAEFVEDRETLEHLARIGVDYGQGYGIHQPEPLLPDGLSLHPA
ncbi:MAG TPA: EAL domain-containing protein [Burkholderiales bacterium]|nr:EAL domain-containing protein [Burkholderiales bacterium]